MLETLLEQLHELSILLLLLSSFFYYRHLKKIKRERKLTPFEFTMYITTQLACLLWGFTMLIYIIK
ncbi:hypothetical protein [Oceanobacillus indicireducens]|uniref:hypothetical protein n=1 Tax=Oceanobacillus indicireducens TaxID=1004261 RepID=UPI001E337566|nr:hypothetical protein [Oceanobacillus indicireducens]